MSSKQKDAPDDGEKKNKTPRQSKRLAKKTATTTPSPTPQQAKDKKKGAGAGKGPRKKGGSAPKVTATPTTPPTPPAQSGTVTETQMTVSKEERELLLQMRGDAKAAERHKE